jgi:hypothetical protein
MDIRSWLADLKLEEYADAFEENDINENNLTELTENDLSGMRFLKLL